MPTIYARPYDDPLNTVMVRNDDPSANNKLYAGIRGTHLEQRCCDNKPPYRESMMTGWYIDSAGNRVADIVEYWSRPENREGGRYGWWNAETPPGLGIEYAAIGQLMCDSCLEEKTLWDEYVEGWEFAIGELLPVIQGISIAASYFPVVGTAVSFILDSSVSLAKGASLDEAALDGIGNSLPGQPASGAAYRAVRTIMRDGSFDEVALSAVPVDGAAREALASSVRIAVAIANGEEMSDIALNEMYAALPETGKRGVDVARRILDGEDIQEFVVAETTRAAAELARTSGDVAMNRFVVESGFQSAVETIDLDLQAACRTGISSGHIEARQLIGVFPSDEEHVERNDELAAKGEGIIASGTTWRGRKLADIRSGPSFTFSRKELDPLTHTEQLRTNRHEVNEQWQRGFVVAIGLCDGIAEDSEDQQTVRLSLGKFNAQQGFDAGQYIQQNRATGEWREFLFTGVGEVRTEVEGAHGRTHDPTEGLDEARRRGPNVQWPSGGPQ